MKPLYFFCSMRERAEFFCFARQSGRNPSPGCVSLCMGPFIFYERGGALGGGFWGLPENYFDEGGGACEKNRKLGGSHAIFKLHSSYPIKNERSLMTLNFHILTPNPFTYRSKCFKTDFC